MRLNRLGDEGGQAICRALLKNTTLSELNLGSNELSEPTAAMLSQVVVQNTALRSVELSCNRLGPVGGDSSSRAAMFFVFKEIIYTPNGRCEFEEVCENSYCNIIHILFSEHTKALRLLKQGIVALVDVPSAANRKSNI